MALGLKLINRCESCTAIKRLGGKVLDVKTECAVCVFENNGRPVPAGENNVIQG